MRAESLQTRGGESLQPTVVDSRSHIGGDALAEPLSPTIPDTTPRAALDKPSIGAGRIGDYELIKELGRGGMGVVFKARQVSLNRDVALKMILAGEFAGESQIKRFQSEAEAAAGLDHPNLVPIYEIGESDGRHFFSMKLVEGGSLSHKLPAFTNHHRAAVTLMAKIARAVHYAHQHGVLHRDLKPGNILMDAQGEPHVTDFGLATRIQGGSHLTLSGAILGTPSYMAPEQASGQTKKLTTAADVYSLGAIFYQLLVGHPPFHGDNVAEILQQVREEDPPKPSALMPSVDRDLETICLKCLHKESARRYGSAEALADDLERWLRLEPIHARPTTTTEQITKWVRRKPVIAVLGGALFLVGVAGLSGVLSQWRRAENEATESRQRLIRVNVVNGTRFAREGDLAGALLWYTEALKLQEGSGPNEEIHRIRIGSLLQEIPQLRRVWLHKQPVWLAQLSPSEDRIATISGPDAIRNRFKEAELRIWDYRSGEPVSPPIVFSGGRPPTYRIRDRIFSPDGQKIVTVRAQDVAPNQLLSEVTLCDPLTGRSVLPPLKHEGLVLDVAFSSDGRFLATASDAGIAKVWDLAQGASLVSNLSHDKSITTVRFSPDNARLVTGSMDKTAKVWNFHTGELTAVLKHGRFVFDVEFNQDGTRIVTAAADPTGGEFRVWDAAAGTPICSSESVQARIEGVVYQATFSHDGRQILTASYDGNAGLWDSTTARMLSAPLKHDHGVLMAVFSPDSSRAVTASFDKTARLWRTDGPSSAFAILNHCSFVLEVLFSKNGQQIVTASTDGMVRVWDLPGLPAGTVTLNHSNFVLHAEFSRDGSRVLTASVDQTARVWDAATGNPITPPMIHDGAVNHAAFNPDGTLVVTASADGTARLWDANTGKQSGRSLLHSNSVWHAEFNHAGTQVATASGQFRNLAASSSLKLRDFSKPKNPRADINGEARVWDVRTGEPVTPSLFHSDAVVHASFNPDGKSVVTSSADRTSQIWSVPDGHRIGSEMPHAGQVFRASFNAAGTLIVTVSGGDGTLQKNAARLWYAGNGQPLGRSFEHSDIIYTASLSSKGDRLATGSEDATARVWDLRTGKPVTPPIVNGSIVLDTSFSPDGRYVLTASKDGTARVWDAVTGEMIAQLRIHRDRINTAAFSPDGQRILTASDDGTVKVSPLPRSDWRIEDLTLLAQVLSARQIHSRGTEFEPLDERAFRQAWMALCQRFPERFSAVGTSE